MSQLDDAITRYNRLLENGPCKDLAWVDDLHKRMEEEHLSAGGRLICLWTKTLAISTVRTPADALGPAL